MNAGTVERPTSGKGKKDSIRLRQLQSQIGTNYEVLVCSTATFLPANLVWVGRRGVAWRFGRFFVSAATGLDQDIKKAQNVISYSHVRDYSVANNNDVDSNDIQKKKGAEHYKILHPLERPSSKIPLCPKRKEKKYRATLTLMFRQEFKGNFLDGDQNVTFRLLGFQRGGL